MLIYKIISPNTDLVYVGMTNKTLELRLRQHHTMYKRFLVGKSKTREYTSSKVLEHGDATIELIEETEDEEREYHWVRELNACNRRRNLHFDKDTYNHEYHQTNRDTILPQKRAYWAKNTKQIAARRNVQRKENREKINAMKRRKSPCPKCGRVVNHDTMARHQRTKVCQDNRL